MCCVMCALHRLDAQQGENNTAGTVFLFGKVYSSDAKGFVSCCVSVRGVELKLDFVIYAPIVSVVHMPRCG